MNVTSRNIANEIKYVRHKDRSHMLRQCEGQKAARLDVVMDVMISSLEAIVNDMEIEVSGNAAEIEYERHREALVSSLEEARVAKARALEAYEAGVYSVADLKERKDEIEGRIRVLEDDISALEPPVASTEKVMSIRECIEALRDDSVSVEAKNKFLRRIVRRIDYYNDSDIPCVNRVHLDIFLL